MAKLRQGRPQPYDLYAEVHQSTCDKLLRSVKYPFTAFEHRESFPGCNRAQREGNSGVYEYTENEIGKMLSGAVSFVKGKPNRHEPSIEDQIFSFGGSILEQAKRVLDTIDTAGPKYAGPSKREMQEILDGGIDGLIHTLSDFGLYAWCSYLRVIVKQRPQLTLASPRIDLRDVTVAVTATGELWGKYPWWNCYHWCTQLEKVIKCKRIDRTTVTVELKADAHATVSADGTVIAAKAEFDSLRINKPILDKIPLEGIANKALDNKLVFVFDAGQLVATVPLLQSKFKVDSVALPASTTGIDVGIVVRQI